MFLPDVILPDMCMYVEYAGTDGAATAMWLCRCASRQHVVLNIGFCVTDIGIQQLYNLFLLLKSMQVKGGLLILSFIQYLLGQYRSDVLYQPTETRHDIFSVTYTRNI
jgi:hypothetical protein